jgi:hypothetical protein
MKIENKKRDLTPMSEIPLKWRLLGRQLKIMLFGVLINGHTQS